MESATAAPEPSCKEEIQALRRLKYTSSYFLLFEAAREYPPFVGERLTDNLAYVSFPIVRLLSWPAFLIRLRCAS